MQVKGRPPSNTCSAVSTFGKIKRNLLSPKRFRAREEASISNLLAKLVRIESALPLSTVTTKALASPSSRCEMDSEQSRILQGRRQAAGRSSPPLDTAGASSKSSSPDASSDATGSALRLLRTRRLLLRPWGAAGASPSAAGVVAAGGAPFLATEFFGRHTNR